MCENLRATEEGWEGGRQEGDGRLGERDRGHAGEIGARAGDETLRRCRRHGVNGEDTRLRRRARAGVRRRAIALAPSPQPGVRPHVPVPRMGSLPRYLPLSFI